MSKFCLFFLLICFKKVFTQSDSLQLTLPIGHSSIIRHSDFSPDSKRLATISTDKVVKIWEIQSGKVLKSIVIADKATDSYKGKGIIDRNYVSGVKFSPDGRFILTGAGYGIARLWDVISGNLIRSFEGHVRPVTDFAFSPDGSQIATASADQTSRIYDLETGILKFVLTDTVFGDFAIHPLIHNSLEYSPNGDLIVTACGNHAKIWDATNGTLLFILKGHDHPIKSLKFSPNNRFLLTISHDHTSKIWDTQSGNLLQTIEWVKPTKKSNKKKSPIDSSATLKTKNNGTTKIFKWATLKSIESGEFSPNGKYIAFAVDDSTVKICEVASGNLVKEFRTNTKRVYYSCFSPDGKLLMASSEGTNSIIWDFQNGKEVAFLKGQSNSLIGFSEFSPDGNYIFSHDRNLVHVWNSNNGKLLRDLKNSATTSNKVTFNSNGNQILSSSSDGEVRLFDIHKGVLLYKIAAHSESISHIEFCPDGSLFSTASKDSSAKIWDSTDGNFKYHFPNRESWKDFRSFNDTSNSIKKGYYEVWDAKTGKFNPHQSLISFIVNAANFNSDGTLLAVPSPFNSVHIYNVLNGELLSVLNGHSGEVYEARFTPDSKYIVTRSWDQTAIVWDTYSGTRLHTLRDHLLLISDFCLNRDGSMLVTASLDSTAKVWDVKSGVCNFTLKGHLKGINHVDLSADGKYIATASEDKTVRVWDASNGLLNFTLRGHFTEMNFVKFSPDCKNLISASKDGLFKFWDCATGELRNEFLIPENLFSIDFGSNTMVTYKNSLFNLRDLKTGSCIYSWVYFEGNEYLTFLPNRFYSASREASSKLYYVKGLQTIGFDQLDIKYNRPDKVLTALGEAFGNPDTALIRSYYRAWQKRVKKLGVDTSSFEEGFSVPESDFKNRDAIAYDTHKEQLTIHIWGEDKDYVLDRFNIWINEVPLFGQRGISIRNRKIHQIDTTISIRLSAGENKIETSVLSANGIESYRIPLYVKYTPTKKEDETVYFVGIGVDQYRELGHDLNYSVKDIRDLSKALKEKYGNRLIIDTLFNEYVTRDKVLSLKKKLLSSGVNDKVIVSFSGHGLLDKQYDYYLATHMVDFQNPSLAGLPYEDLEWLLDSIPARKKLLLLDACHSGEVDKEELTAMNATKTEGTKGVELVYDYKPTLGMKNSFELMQELFANVNRGTGATVISASGGTQFAHEDGKLKNGVFTFSILELMQKHPEMNVSELKAKVGERVIELTNGLQKPTSRSETIEFDWRVW